MRILLTSGYNNSKHSIAVLELLRRENITVDSCVIINAFSRKRLRYYFRQLDFKEFKKKALDRIFSKYISETMLSDEIKYVNDFLDKHNIKYKSVTAFCKANGINYLSANSLNEKKVIEFISDIDLVIYTGGGIIGKQFIDNVSFGILNCHGGKLPEIRGVNALEWSILKNIPPANTLHFIVRQIDMGPILDVRLKEYIDCYSIDQIRGKGIVYTINDLVDMIKKLIVGDYNLTLQKKDEGKQYYAMHPILKSVVNQMIINKPYRH